MNSWRGISASLFSQAGGFGRTRLRSLAARIGPLPFFLVALLIELAFLAGTGSAMVVGSTFANTSAPPDDPGWFNVADNKSAVYLSNGWIISADHSIGNVGPSTITLNFNGLGYQGIAGTKHRLLNSSGLFPQLSAEADLVMFRIKSVDDVSEMPGIKSLPSLPDVQVAESTVPNGGRVVMIGRGNNADPGPESANPPTLRGFNVAEGPDWNWTWSGYPSGTEYFGFRTRTSYPRTKRWGTNVVYDSKSDSGTDGNWLNALDGYDDDDVDTTPEVFKRNTAAGNPSVGFYGTNRDFVGVMAKFQPNVGNEASFPSDSYDFDGDGFADEAHPTGGDSGGGVFYKRDGQWELAGLMHAIFGYPNQLGQDMIYGNWSLFSDLSVYQPEIASIMTNEYAYSIMGDVNLDGAVSGNGSGAFGVDDVSAFVMGWGYNHDDGQMLGQGDILSWQHGDLNLDGRTNYWDFLIMREALGGSFAASQLSSLIGNFSVPEPSTFALALAGLALLCCSALRRPTR